MTFITRCSNTCPTRLCKCFLGPSMTSGILVIFPTAGVRPPSKTHWRKCVFNVLRVRNVFHLKSGLRHHMNICAGKYKCTEQYLFWRQQSASSNCGKFTDVNKMHIDISNITKKYGLRHSAVSPHTWQVTLSMEICCTVIKLRVTYRDHDLYCCIPAI